MRNLVLLTLILGMTLFRLPEAHAIKTQTSIDIGYNLMSLTLNATNNSSGSNAPSQRTLSSSVGYAIDYNVALFDYQTVVSIGFLQAYSSNLGDQPVSRLSIGAAYHFFRINGQRLVLDNGVEAKSWGISPSFELTVGLTHLAVSDKEPTSQGGIGEFTTSALDVMPRLNVEFPLNPNFLIIARGGYLKALMKGSGLQVVDYSGIVYGLAFKITNI